MQNLFNEGQKLLNSKEQPIEVVQVRPTDNVQKPEYLVRNLTTGKEAVISHDNLVESIYASHKYIEATTGKFAHKEIPYNHAAKIIAEWKKAGTIKELSNAPTPPNGVGEMQAFTAPTLQANIMLRSAKKKFYLETFEIANNSLIFHDNGKVRIRVKWSEFQELLKWPKAMDFHGKIGQPPTVYFLSFNDVEEYLAKQVEKEERKKADDERMAKDKDNLEKDLEAIKNDNPELYKRVREACVWFVDTEKIDPRPPEETIDKEARNILRSLKFIDHIVFPYSEYENYVEREQKFGDGGEIKTQKEFFRKKVSLRVWSKVLGVLPEETEYKAMKKLLNELRGKTLDAIHQLIKKEEEIYEKEEEISKISNDSDILTHAKKFTDSKEFANEYRRSVTNAVLKAELSILNPTVEAMDLRLEKMKEGLSDGTQRTMSAWRAREKRLNELSNALNEEMNRTLEEFHSEKVLGIKLERPEDRTSILADKRKQAKTHLFDLMKPREAELAKEAQLQSVTITGIKKLVLNDNNSIGACVEYGVIRVYEDGSGGKQEYTERFFLSAGRHERTEEELVDAILSAKKIEEVLALSDINTQSLGWLVR